MIKFLIEFFFTQKSQVTLIEKSVKQTEINELIEKNYWENRCEY